MLLNEHVAISTSSVLLTPYAEHHVPTYHEWMQDPEIREATASDPLSLDEEYEMQKSWRQDADKLTFIISKPIAAEHQLGQQEQLQQHVRQQDTLEGTILGIPSETYDNRTTMLGDVNLFLSLSDEADETENGEANTTASNGNSDSGHPTPTGAIAGEIELMIANPSNQSQGYGRSALLAFLQYIAQHEAEIVGAYLASLPSNHHDQDPIPADHDSGSNGSKKTKTENFRYLRVRIAESNTRSLNLFQKVGFQDVNGGKANWFGEIEMRLGQDRSQNGHGHGHRHGHEKENEKEKEKCTTKGSWHQRIVDLMRTHGVENWMEIGYRYIHR